MAAAKILDKYNRTPLQRAIYRIEFASVKVANGLLDCITILMAYGADPLVPSIGKYGAFLDQNIYESIPEGTRGDQVRQALMYPKRRMQVQNVCLLLLLARFDSGSIMHACPKDITRKIAVLVWESRRQFRIWPVAENAKTLGSGKCLIV